MFDAISNWFAIIRSRTERRTRPADPADELIDYLTKQISVPGKAESVLETVDKLRDSATHSSEAQLPAIYLLLEQYLVEIDPHQRFTREALRRHIQREFPELRSSEAFRVILAPASTQQLLLCRIFLLEVVRRATNLLGESPEHALSSVMRWLEAIPDGPARPVPYDLADGPPDSDEAWTELLVDLSLRVHESLAQALGAAADRMYEAVYKEIEYRYRGLESFHVVIRALPEKFLDEHKIQVLSQSRELSNKEERLNAIEQQLLARDRELRKTKDELRAVLNTVGEGILTVDTDGIVVLINQEIMTTWGYTRDELIGEHFTQLFSRSPARAHGRQPRRFMETVVPKILGRRVEMEGKRKNGETFPVELHMKETQIGARQLYTVAVHDITERKEAEQQLIEAKETAEEMSRLKSAFLANMSHEIRTPLTAILGFAEILGQEDLDDPSEFTDLIEQSGNRLLTTLNSVLDMAELEAGAKTIEPEKVNISEEIETAAELFRSRAAEKALTLEVSIPPDPVWARLDAGCLKRIMNNLLSNAVKFTHEGRITISVHERENHFLLSVKDTGIGMDQEFQSQLFEAFRQESTGLDRAYEGSGLGLAITKRLVHIMEGSIDVESVKGEGTLFTVQLPYEISEEVHA